MGVVASMTGYGRAEAQGARIALTVEARTLNHRFLEITLKLGRHLSAHEVDVRRLLQGRLGRGRVDVTAATRRIGGTASAVRLDLGLGTEYLRQVRALAEGVGLSAAEIGVTDLLRLPGVLTVEEAEEDDAEHGLLLKQAVEEALADLVRMRHTEGAALAADLGRHLDALDLWVDEAEKDLPAALARIQARMRERVRTLLGDEPADPVRLAQEVATWAAKTDVAEECTRLRSHLGQVRALLAQGGAVGRQLDFLAQELHREVNTIASKVDDDALITHALQARTLVERIREQVQNVE
jgi:uncharacterized protein (TIGR00255 family)